MTPIPFYAVSMKTINELTKASPLPAAYLREYLETRPGILDDVDIFCKNCRSERQRWQRYDLFDRREETSPGTIVVLPTVLEMFENGDVRQNIAVVIDWLKEGCKDRPVVVSWNHDRDAATVPELQNLPPNFLVLNFNTSKPTPTDLCVPFWAIDTSRGDGKPERKYKANFLGQDRGELRQKIKYAIKDRPGYFWSDERRPESEYLDVLSDSWFTLCPRGGGLNSYRTFEAIQSESIPVIFADDVYLPFSDTIDYRKFSIRIPERMAGDFGVIETVLDSVDKYKMVQMCREYRPRFSLAGIQMRVYQKLREMLKCSND